jgi:aminoglycoside 3-N-acetyltransferase I
MPGLPPVRRSIRVPLRRQEAFDLFFRRLTEWWPLATRSVWLEQATSCHVEVRAGGRFYERSRDGQESTWGVFRELEEPVRAVFSWHPGHPEEVATEVEVRFVTDGLATRVDLEHRDWEKLGERASFVRGLFEGGWGPVLARFAALSRGLKILPIVEGPGCIESESSTPATNGCMSGDATSRVQRLAPGDLSLMHAMLTLFGEVFEDAETYGRARPSAAYLEQLLGGESFIALIASRGDQVVGGLAAYEMRKFEQERSEIYIYDLAVAALHRRQGFATALIQELRRIAAQRGAYVVFVQADLTDAPAIALYTKLGAREDVLHFDIPVER